MRNAALGFAFGQVIVLSALGFNTHKDLTSFQQELLLVVRFTGIGMISALVALGLQKSSQQTTMKENQ